MAGNTAFPLIPFNPNDPTHFSTYGKGGLHEVDTISERNAIPISLRRHGMFVAVANQSTSGGASKNYQLIVNNWYQLDAGQKQTALSDNNNWVEFIGGDGTSGESKVNKTGDIISGNFYFENNIGIDSITTGSNTLNIGATYSTVVNISKTGADTNILGNVTIYGQLTADSYTGAWRIPIGTTVQRPSGTNGLFRYNTSLSKFEGYEGSNWTSVITNNSVIYNEVPTGLIDSSNTTFTTVYNFIPNTSRVYVNGIRQHIGIGNDYIESGSNQITFNVAPKANYTSIIVDYNR